MNLERKEQLERRVEVLTETLDDSIKINQDYQNKVQKLIDLVFGKEYVRSIEVITILTN